MKRRYLNCLHVAAAVTLALVWLATANSVGRDNYVIKAHIDGAHSLATVGAMAPQFVAADDQGKRWELKQFRGTKLILNFFCGCQSCRDIAIAEAKRFDNRRNLKIIVVSYLDLPMLSTFQHDTGLHATFLMDPFADVGDRYGSLTCPRCWVLDEQGIIRYTNGSSGGR